MTAEWLLLAVAPLVGIVIGLMPGLGALFVMLMLYPMLLHVSPWIVVVFYAMMLAARDFSGSVAALGFGMLGEVSSGPALREREIIVSHGSTRQALMDTMWASQVGVIISTVLLLTAVMVGSSTAWLFRSDIQAVFMLGAVMFLLAWAQQSWWKNFLLMAVGYLIGAVGYNMRTGTDFMTFGNAYLTGGIPLLPVILGVYAVPTMLRIANNVAPTVPVQIKPGGAADRNWGSMVRGGAIGAVCGVVPYVGCVITSNLAHWVERWRSPSHSLSHSLSRLSAAEAANNAAHITSLIPFIVMGLAVQPSELVLLEILHTQGIRPQDIMGLVFTVACGVAVSAAVSGWLCGHLVAGLLNWFKQWYWIIVLTLTVLLLLNVAWMGWTADQTWYYVAVFAVSLIVGLILQRRVDALPLVLVLLLQNQLDIVLPRIYQFYLS
jgi:putative tricarboxylic transport membrane protein